MQSADSWAVNNAAGWISGFFLGRGSWVAGVMISVVPRLARLYVCIRNYCDGSEHGVMWTWDFRRDKLAVGSRLNRIGGGGLDSPLASLNACLPKQMA